MAALGCGTSTKLSPFDLEAICAKGTEPPSSTVVLYAAEPDAAARAMTMSRAAQLTPESADRDRAITTLERFHAYAVATRNLEQALVMIQRQLFADRELLRDRISELAVVRRRAIGPEAPLGGLVEALGGQPALERERGELAGPALTAFDDSRRHHDELAASLRRFQAKLAVMTLRHGQLAEIPEVGHVSDVRVVAEAYDSATSDVINELSTFQQASTAALRDTETMRHAGPALDATLLLLIRASRAVGARSILDAWATQRLTPNLEHELVHPKTSQHVVVCDPRLPAMRHDQAISDALWRVRDQLGVAVYGGAAPAEPIRLDTLRDTLVPSR